MSHDVIDFAPPPALRSDPLGSRPRVARRVGGPIARWNDFWFKPTGPGNLGFARFVFFALMLWFHAPIDYTIWGTLPPSFQNANPIHLFKWLGVGMPSVQGLAVAQWVFKVSLLLACIGLFTRASCIAALIAGTYVLGMPHTFGKTGHGDGILVLAMLILALSRCGDAWSIDALVRSWRTGPPLARPLSGEYTWPVRCLWLLTALVFFAAGMAKLQWSGFAAWAWSDNMANMLLQHKIKSNPPTDLGVWIAQYPLLCRVLAAGTIIVEVAFPLALFSRWARWMLVPAMFLAQVGIALTMGVVFTQFMFIYLFWIPFDSIGRGIRRTLAPRFQRRAVFFDGGCGFCRKAVSVLWHLDVLERTELLDVVNGWPGIAARFPQLDRSACLDSMHAILDDGRVFHGYDTYRQLAWVLPAAWVLLPILYLPPVRWIGWKVYRYVASHRHDAGCAVPQVPMERGTDLAPAHKPLGRPAHGRDAHATIESAR